MLPHINRLDDCFGDFLVLVRVVCECGARREIQPQALARLVVWKMPLHELATDALLEVWEESGRGGDCCEAAAAWGAKEFALNDA